MATVDRVLPWRRHTAPPAEEVAPLLALYRDHHPRMNPALISRAYDRALEAHKGQTRKSGEPYVCLLYTSPSPRDGLLSRMPSSA